MTDQAARLSNAHVVANCVCAKCGNALVERLRESVPAGAAWGVMCATCGSHSYISRALQQAQTHRDLTVLDEVAGNYPALDPRLKLSPEKIRAGSLALYGEEE